MEQQYLPDKLSGRRYYVPIRGVEISRWPPASRQRSGEHGRGSRRSSTETMSNAAYTVVFFAAAALVALAVVWWYARRLKQDLDDEAQVKAGTRTVIELAPTCVDQLRGLSSAPILLKQSEEGVRVQIEHRPMMPLMAFMGRDVSAALSAAAAEITERYGMRWVVLVSAGENGRVSILRLA